MDPVRCNWMTALRVRSSDSERRMIRSHTTVLGKRSRRTLSHVRLDLFG
jgi:hypothetical protein